MTDNDYSPEYLEALHESITTPDMSVKTDTDKIREMRTDKELYLREHMDNIYGLSLYERVLYIRENLFDENVRGDKPSEIRKRDIGLMEGFLEAGLPEEMYPKFVKLIDRLDTHVQSLPAEQQSEASIRLASIIYDIGIPSHYFLDGNGQTLRLVALSYIHQYSPDLRDKYFALRKTDKDPQPLETEYADHIVNSVGMLEDDPIFESEKTYKYLAVLLGNFKSKEHKEKVALLYKTYLETGECPIDDVSNKWIREVFKEGIKMYKETETDIKTKLGATVVSNVQ